MTAAVFVVLLLASPGGRRRAALPGLVGGVLVFAVLTLPYALPYLNKARSLEPRSAEEISRYSAAWFNYLASPPQNWLWGWTAPVFGGPELNLFPGAVAFALALVAVACRQRRRLFLVYAAVAGLSVELSFGLNGHVYSLLDPGVLHGFRAPARFAIIACCAIAMLAGLGADALFRRLSAVRPSAAAGAIALTFVLLAVDYRNTGMTLTDVAYDPPTAHNVYKTIRSIGPGAVLELPVPALNRLPGREVHYAFASIGHWYPLVNGYSGFYPREYFETISRIANFPDDRSLAQLKNIGVRYIVVHPAAYASGEYADLALRMANRPELRPYGRYPAQGANAELFLLER
jgi:hypothetical protein